MEKKKEFTDHHNTSVKKCTHRENNVGGGEATGSSNV